MSSANVPMSHPRRLLAIDGGGLLGLIPAECLVAIEEQLNDLTGTQKLLCERFDLIAGTSTGAILAAGLGLGKRADELRDFYLQFGREIFTKLPIWYRLWHSYASAPLERRLKEVFLESTTLGSDRLRTQILIVAKNATLGNDWFFSNNPNNRFFKNNAGLPLWQVVRASTAAPTYFPPQPISVPDDNGNLQTYEFIDGGVSSYNNPALQVFLEATIPEYGYGWPMGSDKILLLSLGTGFNSDAVEAGKAARYNLIHWARYMVKELMNEANLQQNLLLQILGQRPPQVQSATTELVTSGAARGIPNESALKKVGAGLGAQKLMTYQRVTIGLTQARLEKLSLGDIDPVKVREMDAADQIPNMQRIGIAVAREQVHMDALKQFF
jgi:uncharacterized protein